MDGGSQNSDQQLYGNADPNAKYGSTAVAPAEATDFNGQVVWSAVEFIEHQKSSLWFLLLALVGAAAAVGVFFLTSGDFIASGIILALALIFGVGAARKPRTLDYKLDGAGITVDKKVFPYEEFSHFAVVREGDSESILLTPAKRWAVPLSLYFPQQETDKIVDTLSLFVPFEQHNPGYIDRFLHRIRF